MINYLTVAVLFVLTSYGLLEAWPLIMGPTLSIASPTNNAPFPSGVVTVRGEAVRAARLTLDGTPVLRGEDGNFSSTLTFPRGGSILTFVAADRFGRTVTATRTIFVP